MKTLLFNKIILFALIFGLIASKVMAYPYGVQDIDYGDLPGGSYFNISAGTDLNTPLFFYTCTGGEEPYTGYTFDGHPITNGVSYDGCFREYHQGTFEHMQGTITIYYDKIGDANGNFFVDNTGTCGNFYKIPDPYTDTQGHYNPLTPQPITSVVPLFRFHNNDQTGWLGNYETKINFFNITSSVNSVTMSGNYTYGVNASSTIDEYNQLVFSFYDFNSGLTIGTHTINFSSENYGTRPFSFTKSFNLDDAGSFYIESYFKNSETASTSNILGCGTINVETETSTTTESVFSCNPFSGNIATFFLNTDFSLSNCISDIGIFLFKPNAETLANFTDLKGSIENKPPFGYFNIIKDSISDISTTSSATTSLDTITIPTPIQNLIFTPIKIGLGGLIWFAGIVYLFIRIKHIQL